MAVPFHDATLGLGLVSAGWHSEDSGELERLVIALFGRIQFRLSNYVTAFGLPHHDAADVVQEAFGRRAEHFQDGLRAGPSDHSFAGWGR